MQKCDTWIGRYTPGIGLSGHIRQCLFQIWFCPDEPKPLQYERTYLTMSDGGTISVDWAKAEPNKAFLRENSIKTPER